MLGRGSPGSTLQRTKASVLASNRCTEHAIIGPEGMRTVIDSHASHRGTRIRL